MNEIQLVMVSAGILAVLINIFESIYPAEKYAKPMCIIFSLVFILSLVKPIICNIDSLGDTIETIEVIKDDALVNSGNTLEYFKGSVERNISSRMTDILSDNGIAVKEIKTSINISENGSISITEITIAAENAAQGAEIIDIVKRETDEQTLVKIKENIQ